MFFTHTTNIYCKIIVKQKNNIMEKLLLKQSMKMYLAAKQ